MDEEWEAVVQMTIRELCTFSSTSASLQFVIYVQNTVVEMGWNVEVWGTGTGSGIIIIISALPSVHVATKWWRLVLLLIDQLWLHGQMNIIALWQEAECDCIRTDEEVEEASSSVIVGGSVSLVVPLWLQGSPLVLFID